MTSGGWSCPVARTWPTRRPRPPWRQLELRYRHGAMLSQSFVEAGIHAVHVDNVYGPAVTEQLDRLTCRRRSSCCGRPSTRWSSGRRAGDRAPTTGGGATGSLVDAVRRFDAWLAETPPIGLWVDSTHQTPDQTVDWILEHWDQAHRI